MKIREIIFWIHLIVGVVLGLIIGFMAITGILMAYQPQIMDMAEKNVRYVEVPTNQPPLSLKQIRDKLQEQAPEIKANSIMLRSDPRASLMISTKREGASLYINPYTGLILGKESQLHDWMDTIEHLHRWLGSREIGKPITGVAVIGFLILLLSGIFVWVPNTTLFFKPNLKGKARNWNWHNVIGIWCAPVLFITIITGIIMSHQWANNLLYKATGNPPPVQMRPGGESEKEQAEMKGENESSAVDLDGILSIAKSRVPDWSSMMIRIPKRADKPVNITIQEKLAANVMGRSQLVINPTTFEIVKWEPAAKANLGMKMRTWVKYLHTGQAFGFFHQTLMVLGALGTIFLIWTGLSLSWVRFFNRR